MKKHVVVIGGGIAGLSAGVYAQKCGFNVTILESHNIAGGNCTAWKRKGYLFEGGMHWLTGSNKNEPIYRLWTHIGALDDSVEMHYPEPFKEFHYKGEVICLYRDIDRTEQHLIALSPADEKPIRDLCNSVRKVEKLVMPLMDIKGVKVTKKNRPSLRLLFRVLHANYSMRKASKIPKEAYIRRFKHKGIQALLTFLTTDKHSATWLFFSMANRARGDAGFPQGGSLPFVNRIVKTFKDAGGEIIFNQPITRVAVKDGKATGVGSESFFLSCDAVIVTADTMQMDYLFETPPKAQWLDEMRAKALPTMCVFVSLGIDADLTQYAKNCTFKLDSPLRVGRYNHLLITINNYANDPTYSPKGKAAVTLLLLGDSYDFWKNSKDEGRYEAEKEKIAQGIIEALASQLPETKDKVEVYDVATPLTYERYCANWRGSWMTMMAHTMRIRPYPPKVDNLENVYFGGHRMRAPGGLPIAAISGRAAVQYLCRDTDTLFISED